MTRNRALSCALSVFFASQLFDLPPLATPARYGNIIINRSSEANGQPPVSFSHWSHRMLYTCRVCHLELGFELKVNATEITETLNREGEYCGACHDGETAFGHTDENCEECHNGGKGPRRRYAALRRFRDLSNLPEASFGNEIDWVEALELGIMQPSESISDEELSSLTFERMYELDSGWSMIPPAYFDHGKHQQWLDCANCHPDIFNVKRNTTKHFEMMYILKGEFCGVCHLRVAFPMDDCKRCHPAMIG